MPGPIIDQGLCRRDIGDQPLQPLRDVGQQRAGAIPVEQRPPVLSQARVGRVDRQPARPARVETESAEQHGARDIGRLETATENEQVRRFDKAHQRDQIEPAGLAVLGEAQRHVGRRQGDFRQSDPGKATGSASDAVAIEQVAMRGRGQRDDIGHTRCRPCSRIARNRSRWTGARARSSSLARAVLPTNRSASTASGAAGSTGGRWLSNPMPCRTY